MTPSVKYYLRAVAVAVVYGLTTMVTSFAVLIAANFTAIAETGTLPDAATMQHNPELLSAAMLAGNVLALAILWLSGLIRRRPLPHSCPALPHKWGLSLLGFALVAVGLSLTASPFGLEDAGTTATFQAMTGTVAGAVCLALVGPVTEEVVFREGIQRLLVRAGLRPFTAIGIAALIFALAHGNPAQAVPALLCGCLLGLLYHKCGDVRLSATAHVMNNAASVLLFFLPALETTIAAWPAPLCIGLGAALALTGGGIFARWWRLSPTLFQNPDV